MKILIANDLATEMFGVPEEQLIGKKLTELLKAKKKHQGSLQELDIDPETGSIVKIAGKIVSLFHLYEDKRVTQMYYIPVMMYL